MRLGDVFITVCMVLIAGSAGAAVYFGFGLRPSEGVVVAIAVLTAMMLHNSLTAGLRGRSSLNGQIRDLSAGNIELARQVAKVERRVATLESQLATAFDKTEQTINPLTVEIGELGALVKQLAESAAEQRLALNELTLAERKRTQASVSQASKSPTAPTGPAAPGTPAATSAPAPSAVDDRVIKEMLATLRSAVAENRFDLYLQPIVTLPQRRVRFYEALTRLRNERGEVVPANDFITIAQGADLVATIDNMAVFRCVQVVRRLLLNNRDVGLFCNLSEATLNDGVIFPQLLEFLDANRAIAGSIVLEFNQQAVRQMGPIEIESLATLAERGYRFSLDHVTDLRFEPRDLAMRGFRFVKVPAALLLNRSGNLPVDIHPADISDLLARHGIELVAERIENERSVVDLLDYDVRYGQGFVFSAPRPVRAEALQGNKELGAKPLPKSTATATDPSALRRLARPVPARDLGTRDLGTRDLAAKDMGESKRAPGIAQIARRM
jgi:cyclic-di-GMP phosphodiesterase, flagellum assembly factor TipF